LTLVFLERDFDSPITDADFRSMLETGANCIGLYRVDWLGSLVSTDGSRLFCRFSAPDAESARVALRQAGANTEIMWPGTIHDAVGVSEGEQASANVVVRRRFDEPVELADIQAIEEKGAVCLEIRNVSFLRTFFSSDRKRMVCLYRAPDAESVRQAQIHAGMPFHDVWTFRNYQPAKQ
jgi:hypothetical protein